MSERKPDVVLLGGPTADGGGVRVMRLREEGLSTGEVRPIETGKPITGELVTLRPREETPRVCDVEVLYAPPVASEVRSGQGPAKVATQDYRAGWEAIFGNKKKELPS